MSSTNSLPSVSTLTIANGGTAETLLSADATRQTLFIQPKTEACLVNFGATAGIQATGTLTVTTNPDADDTIAVNAITFTFKAEAEDGTEITIGANQTETAANMVTVLNASAEADVALATYSSNGAIVTITYDAGGTDGNAFALANSSGGDITRSAATLAGGSNTVGGVYLAQYQSLMFHAADSPQIREAIYVLSATNSSKIDYWGGQGA